MAEKKKDERTRNWQCIVYPESAPSDWRDILDDYCIPWVESPLHDKDLDKNGLLKKEHYHITLLFEGNKSLEQILELVKPLNCPQPVKVPSVRANVRYMAHLDNPTKARYSESDIIGHGGVDVADYLKPTSMARYEIISEMVDFIDENNIVEYRDLVRYAKSNQVEWFYLLCDSATYFISSYIKSCRHRIVKVDSDTGEVFEFGDLANGRA